MLHSLPPAHVYKIISGHAHSWNVFLHLTGVGAARVFVLRNWLHKFTVIMTYLQTKIQNNLTYCVFIGSGNLNRLAIASNYSFANLTHLLFSSRTLITDIHIYYDNLHIKMHTILHTTYTNEYICTSLHITWMIAYDKIFTNKHNLNKRIYLNLKWDKSHTNAAFFFFFVKLPLSSTSS